MSGEDNIPDAQSHRKSFHHKSTMPNAAHRSPAPVVLIVVDKGDHVDAFWFFFYSFNLGNQVLGVRFGNHVGDWEHTMIRFRKGKPIQTYFSEHEWGAGYEWDDCEKKGDRIYTYSGFGTHAMYRSSGVHHYVLPFGLLQDITDRGVLWDPLLNLYSYTYVPSTDTLRASTHTPDAPENWFYFRGQWGDKSYPMNDPRQYKFAGELHYVDGPTGPWKKNLGRQGPCQGRDEYGCLVLGDVEAKDKMPRFISKEEWRDMKKKMGSRTGD
jgi:hypothetical protein